MSATSMPAVTQARLHDLVSRLTVIARQYADAAFATSLAAEDMVITHAIFTADLPISVFTLDTGRLHDETVAMIDTIGQRYCRPIEVFRPDPEAVAAHVNEHGAYAFYESVEFRRACFGIRKVEPLRRSLAWRGAWLTGQRREQAVSRGDLPEEEQDPVFGLYKFNPLAEWTQDDVWTVIDSLGVPYNPLHDKGYP